MAWHGPWSGGKRNAAETSLRRQTKEEGGWKRRINHRLEGPVISGIHFGGVVGGSGGAGGNPKAKGLKGGRGERLALVFGGHPLGHISGGGAVQKRTFIRVTGGDGRAGFSAHQHGGHGIESKFGFLLQGAMARKTVFAKNGFDEG